MNSLEYIERELEWLRKGGSRELDQEAEIKNLEQVKTNLKRLEKLEKVVEILKGTSIIVVDKNFMTINTNGIWRNDNSGGYDVLKEVFGE